MIKAPLLFNPNASANSEAKPQSLPSRQQLHRLRNGDTVQLNSYGEYLQCLVIFRLGHDLVGRVTNPVVRTLQHGLEKDDLVAFTTSHIYNVVPGTHDNDLPACDWMVCSWPDTTKDVYLLRTKYPSLLAHIAYKGNYASIKLVRMYDEPENYDTDIPKILEGGRRWFAENYLKHD